MYKFTRKGGDFLNESSVKHKFDTPFATWFEVVGGFQVFLAKCGYTFAEDFDMATILKKEHDKLLDKQYKKKDKESASW